MQGYFHAVYFDWCIIQHTTVCKRTEAERRYTALTAYSIPQTWRYLLLHAEWHHHHPFYICVYDNNNVNAVAIVCIRYDSRQYLHFTTFCSKTEVKKSNYT